MAKPALPLWYIPQLPVEEMNVLNVVLLTFLSIAFMILGFLSYKRRDLIG